MARGKKPAVTSYERKRWLEQLENGKGITMISEEARRDIRVVKRHIEIAREERNVARARHDFLLGKLEQHQADLLDEVRHLQQLIAKSTPTSLRPDDPIGQKIYDALAEHVKRLPLKGLLEKYEEAVTEFKRALWEVNQKLEEKEAELKSVMPDKIDIYPWTPAVMEHLESNMPLNESSGRKYNIEKEALESCRVSWGSSILTRSSIIEAEIQTIIDFHEELLSFAETVKPSLQKQLNQINERGDFLADELDIYLLKRMIPGRCRYCPF